MQSFSRAISSFILTISAGSLSIHLNQPLTVFSTSSADMVGGSRVDIAQAK
jgi:hypothetical protein